MLPGTRAVADGDEKWSGSRYVLKVQLKGFSDKLYMGNEGGLSMSLKIFGQSKWKEAIHCGGEEPRWKAGQSIWTSIWTC